MIYAQNPQATQVAGFKQWQTAFHRTVNRGAKAIRIAAPIIKKLTPADQKRLDTTDERSILVIAIYLFLMCHKLVVHQC